VSRTTTPRHLKASDTARVWIRHSMCTALRSAALALVVFLLLIFGGDTGLLFRLLLLLLAGFLPTALLLAALAALLVLLIALIGHLCSLGQIKENASRQRHVPTPTKPVASRRFPPRPLRIEPPLSRPVT
jgi:hypothetical protein